jgi:hypothetical protein
MNKCNAKISSHIVNKIEMETVFPALNRYLKDIKMDKMPTMIQPIVDSPI